MNIQVIELSSWDCGDKLLTSLRDTGFAIVKIPEFAPLLSEVYGEWQRFFAQDAETKLAHKYQPGSQVGYFPFLSENAKGSPVKDLKEFYHVLAPFHEVPKVGSDPLVSSTLLAKELNILGLRLLELLDMNLPQEVYGPMSEDLAIMAQRSPSTLFRALHYPPLKGDHEPGAVRAAAHEDINLITLLPAATQPGLEVLDASGNWHKVACDPGMIIVNAGDMLQEATGGYIRSTTHRVVNPTDGSEHDSRYSLPLFVHPKPDARLSPRYTAQEYLNERLREIGLK